MKNIKIIPIIAIIFIVVGIFYLDFDDLGVYTNYRAYILILLGICTVIFSFYKPEKVNLRRKK